MPKLRVLSGADIIRILELFGFVVISQRGSHIKLSRLVTGSKQTLTVPNHKEIDTGTLKAIFRQATAYIPDNDLRSHFYTE